MGKLSFRWQRAACYLSRNQGVTSDLDRISLRRSRLECIKPSKTSLLGCARHAAHLSETRSTPRTSTTRPLPISPKRLKAGRRFHFLPVPREGSERKTFIVSKKTYALAQKIAKRHNVKITGCGAYQLQPVPPKIWTGLL